MNKRENTIRKVEYIGILILGILVVYGILWKAGTITSGYHFVDDHELIRMEFGFERNNATLWDSIQNWINIDLRWRFRPLYWVERVTGAYFWGSELLYWNHYTAIKGVITFCCLYFMSRFLKHDRLISVFVPCIVMLGGQFTPWYRSANQESTGLLLAAITLCLIAVQAYYGKYKGWRYNVPIVIGAVLCGLVKESFTLFMPAFIGMKYWLEYWDENATDTKKKRWLTCLKSNVITYAIILLAMLINVYMIVFRVGVDNVSYAGFHEETPLSVYIAGIETSLTMYTKWHTIVGMLIVLLVVMSYKNIEKKYIGNYIGHLFIGGYICAVQLVAHAKSGMWERYIIPYVVGYVLIFVLQAYRILQKDIVHKIVFLGMLCLLLCKTVPGAYSGATGYRDNGIVVNQILQCAEENTVESDRIVCAFADEELNFSAECWLEARGRTQAYTYVYDEWKNEAQLAGTVPENMSGLDAKAAMCYIWQVEDVLELMGITKTDEYVLHDFNGFCMIVRNEASSGAN